MYQGIFCLTETRTLGKLDLPNKTAAWGSITNLASKASPITFSLCTLTPRYRSLIIDKDLIRTVDLKMDLMLTNQCRDVQFFDGISAYFALDQWEFEADVYRMFVRGWTSNVPPPKPILMIFKDKKASPTF